MTDSVQDENAAIASSAEKTSANVTHSPYVVGIDLGTTNSILSWVDTTTGEDHPAVNVLSIPQLTGPGSVEERDQLASFLYQVHESEFAPEDLNLPWPSEHKSVAGAFARQLGAKTPIRLVASAKSWLSHAGVDRRAALLPLQSPEEVEKISPLRASAAYLSYLRHAWDTAHPEAPLAQQQVTLTVPASFDPSARDYTIEAAHLAGIHQLTLLEEPQAALYHWVQRLGEEWRKQVQVGDVILVVDVGGGTTDLSLVAVSEEDGSLQLNRVAVGDHILLGGDNMDLALAYRLKQKLEAEGKSLQSWQVMGLAHGCREAKEALFADPSVASIPIVVPSRGSKLMGATLRTELTREEVETTLVDGFFPQVAITEHPRQAARTALTQIGLPYAQDAAVTRHLAAFLCKQAAAAESFLGDTHSDDFIRPTCVLLNGGAFKAEALSSRMLEVLNGWLTEAGAEPARLLSGADLDLAVSRGAAYYGYVRRGRGVRIRGGTASSFYVGIESAMPAIPGMEPPLQALCVAPFGMEEGTHAEIPSHEFGLVLGEPVRFRFFGSTTRREDLPGTLLEDWEPHELEELPEIQAILHGDGERLGTVVPVRLASRVTELGTLALEAIGRDEQQRWKVEFNVREG
ncbi:DnaK-related protein [gamma proteobacterium HdN1]|nr:DnaK-related protein [gamma proteobacterium HdN1]